MSFSKLDRILILFFSLGLFLTSMVSAADLYQETSMFIDSVAGFVRPVFELAVGDVSPAGGFGSSDVLFAKSLLLVLLVSIIFTIAERISLISGNDWAKWAISLIIPILGIRFLEPQWITQILLPYSATGIAITAILPFIIYFIFVEFSGFNPLVRRTAWLFYAVIFVGLYFVRVEDMERFRWVYPVVIVLSFILAFFDGTIQRLKQRYKAEKVMSNAKYMRYTNLLKTKREMEDALSVAIREGDERLMTHFRTEIDRIDGLLSSSDFAI